MTGRVILFFVCLAVLPAAAHAQPAVVKWTSEKLTVHAANVPFQQLMGSVVARTGIEVSGLDRLHGLRTIDLKDLSISEALPRLLEGVNYIVTEKAGVLHLRIHSMAGDAEVIVTKGPLHIPTLTDRVVGESHTVDDPDVVDELDDDEIEELEELDEVRKAAAPNSLPDIIGASESEYVTVKMRALKMLGESADPIALTAVVKALGDDDLDVSLAASDVLATMKGDRVVPILIAQLAPEVNADIQFAALRALALRADLASLPALRQAAPHTDPLIRDLAAAVVRKLDEREKAIAKLKNLR